MEITKCERESRRDVVNCLTTQSLPNKPGPGITLGRLTIRDYGDYDDDDDDDDDDEGGEGNRKELETAQL